MGIVFTGDDLVDGAVVKVMCYCLAPKTIISVPYAVWCSPDTKLLAIDSSLTIISDGEDVGARETAPTFPDQAVRFDVVDTEMTVTKDKTFAASFPTVVSRGEYVPNATGYKAPYVAYQFWGEDGEHEFWGVRKIGLSVFCFCSVGRR